MIHRLRLWLSQKIRPRNAKHYNIRVSGVPISSFSEEEAVKLLRRMDKGDKRSRIKRFMDRARHFVERLRKREGP